MESVYCSMACSAANVAASSIYCLFAFDFDSSLPLFLDYQKVRKQKLLTKAANQYEVGSLK